jgi:hypothetical protein
LPAGATSSSRAISDEVSSSSSFPRGRFEAGSRGLPATAAATSFSEARTAQKGEHREGSTEGNG